MFRPILIAACAAAAFVSQPVAAHDPVEQTPERPAATLEDMSWLLGSWAGTGIGGHPAGETFSYAGEGQMVGHFWQLDENGGVNFYELITVTQDGDSLVMRIKHFTGDLTGWEEKPGETALNFPLTKRSAEQWVFGPVTFDMPAPDRLDVSVLMRRNADGPDDMLNFSYTRVSAP